jgi:hypothetical protein
LIRFLLLQSLCILLQQQCAPSYRNESTAVQGMPRPNVSIAISPTSKPIVTSRRRASIHNLPSNNVDNDILASRNKTVLGTDSTAVHRTADLEHQEQHRRQEVFAVESHNLGGYRQKQPANQKEETKQAVLLRTWPRLCSLYIGCYNFVLGPCVLSQNFDSGRRWGCWHCGCG